MIDSQFLDLLCCPETRQALHVADKALIDDLNARIVRGELSNRGGQRMHRPCDGGLIREDRRYVYPIFDGLPVLLIHEAVPVPAGL